MSFNVSKPKKISNKKINNIIDRILYGGGLTMSKTYLKSWIIPIRVHVCQIDEINPYTYVTIMNRYGIPANYDKEPRQTYSYGPDEYVPNKALQLPYRIILISGGQSVTWYIENETEFTRLCKIFIHARDNVNNNKVINTVIEQHPVD